MKTLTILNFLMVKKKEMNKKINRRNFIKTTALTVVGLEMGYLIFDVSKNKSKESNNAELFKAGQLSLFEKNKMYPFNSGKFYLSVLKDGGLLAISIKCTHLGCIVQPSETGFLCPCHASAFDKHGEVLSPPATRALDIFPISLVKGEILVDIHNPIKRNTFDKSQISYV